MTPITSQGHDGLYYLSQKGGQPASQGSWVASGKASGILQGGQAPQSPTSTGRIVVKVGSALREFFPSVYGLFWQRQGLPDAEFKSARSEKSNPLSW